MTDTAIETAVLTADAVLIGSRNGMPHVLLIRRQYEPFKDHWALPGGHVDAGEETYDAAHRELAEETGLQVSRMRDFATYAEPGRDPRGRYVSFAYAARIDETPEPKAGDDAAEAQWVPVDDVLSGRVPVAFDHKQIIGDASYLAVDWMPISVEQVR